MSNLEYLNDQTAFEISANLDGLKSFVMLTLHNEHYKDGKFTITFKGDAIDALVSEEVSLRLVKAATAAKERRDEALSQIRGLETAENLVTF